MSKRRRLILILFLSFALCGLLLLSAAPFGVTAQALTNWVKTDTLSLAYPFNADYFGISVAVSGDTAAFGAPYRSSTGAVSLFNRVGGRWVEGPSLQLSGPTNDREFGQTVALDGDTLMVAARDNTTYRGSVYVYTRSGANWTFQQKLQPPTPVDFDYFGLSITLNGNAALISAPFVTDSGAVFLFMRTGTTWSVAQTLTHPDPVNGRSFGSAISLSADTGDTLFVSGSGPGFGRQSVFVFTRSGSIWTPQQTLDDAIPYLDFGSRLQVVGDTAVISAAQTINFRTRLSLLFIYKRTAGVWVQTQRIDSPDPDNIHGFGAEFGFNGSALIAYAPYVPQSGTPEYFLYVYAFDGSVWVRTQTLPMSGLRLPSYHGQESIGSIAMTADFALVGSPNRFANQGVVYEYSLSAGNGTPTPTPTPSPTRTDTVGVFKQGAFYLRNTNTTGFADIVSNFGDANDLPIVGDWDADGIDTIGVFRPTTGQVFLRNTNTSGFADLSFTFGNPGDQPIAGRWIYAMAGSGVGVYRPSTSMVYLKRTLTTGPADYALIFGDPGDQPLTGAFYGEVIDGVGLYRQTVGRWFLVESGATNGMVVLGGAYPEIMNPVPNTRVLAGDWVGDGVMRMAALERTGASPSFTLFAANTENPTVLTSFVYGPPDSYPLAGKWKGPGMRPPSLVRIVQPVAPPAAQPTRTDADPNKLD